MWTLFPLSLGCASDPATLQALVNARSEQVALDAELGARFAVATGGMAAELATLDMADWLEMEDQALSVHPDVEQVLGLNGPGQVTVDQATGAVVVAWDEVEFTPEVWGRVELDMLRPQTTAVLRMQQELGVPPGVSVEGRYTLRAQDQAYSVNGSLLLALADREQRVELPADEDTRMVWPAEGGFWPQTGQFSWSEDWENAARTLEALPVEQARPNDLVWPVVVSAEDWSNRVELDLSRVGSGSEVSR